MPRPKRRKEGAPVIVPPTPPAPPRPRSAIAVLAAALIGGAVGAGVHVASPPPEAAAATGADEAFSTQPYRRRATSRVPLRPLLGGDSFRFHFVPTAQRVLEVRLIHPAAPVSVLVNGAEAAVVHPEGPAASMALTSQSGPIDVALVPAAVSGGAAVASVAVRHGPAGLPSPWLLLMFASPAAITAAALLSLRPSRMAIVVTSAAVAVLQGAALLPYGLVRSPYAMTLSLLLAIGAIAAALFGRLLPEGAAKWGAMAFGVAWLVQGIAATTPLMVVSDQFFHAHKLAEVAGGNLFPTSVTQHARPFRFPYGASFYVALVPLLRAGGDPAALVRWGAALSSVAASGALFVVLLRLGAPMAALAVVLLQLLPITFDVHSYGNLSNVFGQAVTVAFLAWWCGRGRGGWPAGAALAAIAATAHFSSFAWLGLLGVALVALDGKRDRARMLALGVGLLAAAAYYARFVPIVFEQLPRLAEGGGAGAVTRGPWREMLDEVAWLRIRYGLPAIVLALFGFPKRYGTERLDRTLVALWAAFFVFMALAITTPLEVRHVYAVTPAVAVAAARGAAWMAERGRLGGVAAVALLLAQGAVFMAAAGEAIFDRYR